MNNNPYRVLGVADGSSEEVCTAAYRNLVKKYHPDLNPDDEIAAVRMAEINAAFDKIKSINKQSSNSDLIFDKEGNIDYFEIVSKYLNGFQYKQALNILNQMDEKNDEWYYYSAVANYGLRDLEVAKELIEIACRIAPDEESYQNMKAKIENGFGKFDPTYKRPSAREEEIETDDKSKLKRIIIIIITIIVVFIIVMGSLKFIGGIKTDFDGGASKDDMPHFSSETEANITIL